MGISNTSRTGIEPGNKFFKGIAIAAILTVAACASSTKRKDAVTGESVSGNAAANGAAVVHQPSRVYGPFPNASGPVPTSSAPAELVENPDRVVLVLGRGLTHGYAYVGVLRALRELRVPIQAIYATEFGALASALYFTQPNPNRIDWALLRFNEKNLGASSGRFSFRLSSPETDLDSRLREVFGERRVETTAEQLHIELQDAKTGEAIEAKSGELWRAVRGALAGANGYDPADFEGRTVRASARKLADEYRVARQNEKYPIVVVSVGSPPSELFRKFLEEQRATLLYVPLPGIDDLDLKKRNQAVFAGKNAVHKSASEILGLVGRRPE